MRKNAFTREKRNSLIISITAVAVIILGVFMFANANDVSRDYNDIAPAAGQESYIPDATPPASP